MDTSKERNYTSPGIENESRGALNILTATREQPPADTFKATVSDGEAAELTRQPIGRGSAAVIDGLSAADKPSPNPVAVSTWKVKPEVLLLIPEAVARKYNVMPLAIKGNSLQIALADADNVLAIEALEARVRMKIEPVIAPAEDIRAAIDRNYESYNEIEKQFDRIAHPSRTTKKSASAEAIAEAPAVRGLELIVNQAVKGRASDIHIEPQEDKVRIRYRIDGVLHDSIVLPLTVHASLISRLKILANMNIADHRPQDGKFSLKMDNREIDVRVATIDTTHGERAVLRILDKSSFALDLTELGFLPGTLKQYKNLLESPHGMILVSGPTGSGKTTTLYASVNGLDYEKRNIVTVEDPVEYCFDNITQIQVNPRAGLTFASGLRAIMRHDPDVILVGEVRDSETADMAVRAALTGHLVLSSVHANDTAGVLFRLLDLGIEAFLVNSSLVGIIAQRMVRRVCPHCRGKSVAPIDAQLAYFEEMGEMRDEFVYGKGCSSCNNTGYLGRTAVFEILTFSDEIRKMLRAGASAAEIHAQARSEGMVPMMRDGMLKVQAGITTPDEVLRNVYSI